jgi:WD40 repeat protein
LWDWATGKPLGLPFPHPHKVTQVDFHPDGRLLLTGCWDTTARFWSVPEPVQGDAERIRLWVELLTGLELDVHGGVRDLPADTLAQRRRRLEGLDGPPFPTSGAQE